LQDEKKTQEENWHKRQCFRKYGKDRSKGEIQ